jgi:hypothetical protein
VSTLNDTIGFDPGQLVDQIVTKGLPARDAVKLINNLIAVNLGQSPRHFTFSAPLPTSDTGQCSPTFARTFSHQDWTDGESVVQAGESADDKGFNWRFNAIAADLDALHADTIHLYQCMVVLRTALAEALQDVAAELNRLDADTANATQKLPPENTWKIDISNAPQFMGVRTLDEQKVTMWKTDQGVLVLPGVDTVGLTETVSQRLATGALISRAAGDNPDFAKTLAAGTSVAELVKTFGTVPLGDGRTLAQGLSVLPPNSTFTSVDAAVAAVNTQEQAFLRSTVGAVAAVNALTGVTSEGAPLATIDLSTVVAKVPGAPVGLSAGLAKAGIASITDLVALTPTQLQRQLRTQQVTISQAQASEMITRASMIGGLAGG